MYSQSVSLFNSQSSEGEREKNNNGRIIADSKTMAENFH